MPFSLLFTSPFSERGDGSIRFVELDRKVKLNPDSIRSRAELERALVSYRLSINGTVPILRQRLRTHIAQLSSQVKETTVSVQPPLSRPTALCMASDDILLCADDGLRTILQMSLESNGASIYGTAQELVKYPENVKHIESITATTSGVYFAVSGGLSIIGGLYHFNLEERQVSNVLMNGTA